MAQGIIGLGNPGPEYKDTRHNVGQRVVDGIATVLDARFTGVAGHPAAAASWRGEPLFLIKPAAFMRAAGPAVVHLCGVLSLDAADLVVVFDDLDLPLGRVRARLHGSAGGHNGVRSLIEALGTSDIRRVKVGIGRPGPGGDKRADVAEHVLSPFAPEERATVESACARAGERALALVAARAAAVAC